MFINEEKLEIISQIKALCTFFEQAVNPNHTEDEYHIIMSKIDPVIVNTIDHINDDDDRANYVQSLFNAWITEYSITEEPLLTRMKTAVQIMHTLTDCVNSTYSRADNIINKSIQLIDKLQTFAKK
jgi:hypothetical protein